MKRILFDIETDGLPDTMSKVHCIVLHDLDTGQEFSADKDNNDFCHEQGMDICSFGLARDLLMNAERLYGHNIIGFDLPALDQLLGLRPPGHVVDTLTWSRIVFPDLGKYSLEAWGDRLNFEKQSQPLDWSEWSPLM